MNLVRGALPYFMIPFLISLVLVPVCKRVGFRLGIYAVENKRTVHHGRIVRMGGVAIYMAFLLSLSILWKADDKLNGILIGGAIVFLGGFLDVIYALPPKIKLRFHGAGVRWVMFVCLGGLFVGFLRYNFHPASLFVGDCGAQFMGFTIAALSLLGFKTTALITLGLPILVLFIPISDTLIAILRRKLK